MKITIEFSSEPSPVVHWLFKGPGRWVVALGVCATAVAGYAAVDLSGVGDGVQQGDALTANLWNASIGGLKAGVEQLDTRVEALETEIWLGALFQMSVTRTDSSWGPFSPAGPQLEITPHADGVYRVFGSFEALRDASCTAALRIHSDDVIGSQFVLRQHVVPSGATVSTGDLKGSVTIEALVRLETGSTYTFTIEGHAGGCTTKGIQLVPQDLIGQGLLIGGPRLAAYLVSTK